MTQASTLVHHVHAADCNQIACSVKVQPGGFTVPGTAASFTGNQASGFAQHSVGLASLANTPGQVSPFGQARSQSLQLNAESE